MTTRTTILYLTLIVFSFLLITTTPHAEISEAQKAVDSQAIRITSERMEAIESKGSVVFTGNVVAIKEKMTIHTERLEVFYKKNRDGEKKLIQIIASGNVKIKEGNRTGAAEKAVYDKPREIITLSGNASVREGQNRIQGDKITLYINEDRSVVESSGHKKVEALVFSTE